MKKTISKTKVRKIDKKSTAEKPVKELGILEIRTETKTNSAKPTKQKLTAIEKNGKLISLA